MNAEATYQQAELALVQAQANRYSDTAGLFQALAVVGGIALKGAVYEQPRSARRPRWRGHFDTHRPEKLNALSKMCSRHWMSTYMPSDDRQDGWCGGVTRPPRVTFSSGYDMNEVLEYVKANAKPHYHSEVIDKLANLPQP